MKRYIEASAGQRIAASLIDFTFIWLITGICTIPVLFSCKGISAISFLVTIFFLLLLLLFYKDIFSRSIGKKLIGLYIYVKSREEELSIPKPSRLVLRNLTLVFWPVEVIILLIKNKRIGDMYSKTIVVSKKENVVQTNHKRKIYELIGLLIAGVVLLVISYQSIQSNKIRFSPPGRENRYNHTLHYRDHILEKGILSLDDNIKQCVVNIDTTRADTLKVMIILIFRLKDEQAFYHQQQEKDSTIISTVKKAYHDKSVVGDLFYMNYSSNGILNKKTHIQY